MLKNLRAAAGYKRPVGEWVARNDDAYWWEAGDPDLTWDSGNQRWVLGADTIISLAELGAWVDGWRPARMKFTIDIPTWNGAEAYRIFLLDKISVTIADSLDQETITAAGTYNFDIPISWGSNDIGSIKVQDLTNSDTYISDIQFFIL